MAAAETITPRPLAAYASFAGLGVYWGVWGAAVPRVQEHAHVSDGQLGGALLCLGLGALAAMLVVGRAVDRFGMRTVGAAVAALGVTGLAIAFGAVNLVSLCAALVVVGACSGAVDVAINTLAGTVEEKLHRPVITRSHAAFSAAVVVASLGTGGLYGAGVPRATPFVVVAVVCAIGGGWLARTLPGRSTARAAGSRPPALLRSDTVALLLIGTLGALAFACENAQQNWSAVFAHSELHTSTAMAAVAPAVFAGTVSVTRFAAGSLRTVHPRVVLVSGAAIALVGTLIIAAAHDLALGVVGLALAAVGTAVLFPTLVGLAARTVDEPRRGRATSLLTTVSYLGFLAGPAYVGAFAGGFGLRAAMVAVAALAALLIVLVVPILRRAGQDGMSAKRL